jgi:hypothetical protein
VALVAAALAGTLAERPRLAKVCNTTNIDRMFFPSDVLSFASLQQLIDFGQDRNNDVMQIRPVKFRPALVLSGARMRQRDY